MALTRFSLPNGVVNLGSQTLLGAGELFTTGNVYYVDSGSGSDGNLATDPSAPAATLAAALDKCTASQNDIIVLMPGHAETVTAQVDVDVAGVQIIGIGEGNLRPTFTGNGTIDVFDVSAANVTIANLIFAVPGTDAQTADINVDAAGCRIFNTLHHGSTTSKNKVDIITLTANADDTLLNGVRIYNDTVEIVGAIVLEGACSRVEIANCLVFDTIGITNGAISDEATATEVYVHHNVFKNAKAATVVVEFGNNSTGICSFNHVSGRHTTIASNVTTGTGMDFFENRVTEEAQLNGAVIPAADAD